MSSHSFHNSPGPLSLSVALDGAGWHPAAWRTPNARPDQLFTHGYWADLVALAERGLLDFVTIEDALGLQSGDHLAEPGRRTDQVRGRLDAALIAAFVAPLTRHIGLIPTITTTHTEPFHVAKAVATLDHNSNGRAGWRVQVSARADEAAHFGRRELPVLRRSELGSRGANRVVGELFGEAADAVEAVRRLWDSWEDDAEIRDASTNRFVDRDKLHHVNFIGTRFTVRGALLAALLGPPVSVHGYGQLSVLLSPPVLVPVLLVAGVLLGYGSRWAGGCTSGHGLAGCPAGSPDSWAATVTFFAVAVVVTLGLHALTGGLL
jgi:alkanesulfonate monooxygenase SsuD/methylene tetrahydromethanopterin reductase-like flavin-dependent oxidoreductase (luciferase family)